jgi:DNA-directed RNA polymerase specialized sigma24 family protein
VLAQNLYRDSYRKNRKHRIEVRPIEEYVIADPASDLYSEYLLKEFRSYLQTLPDKENRIIENWLEGQTLRSIGQMEGCSHVSIIFCIKQTLQAYLGQGKSRSLKKKCVKESSLAAAA